MNGTDGVNHCREGGMPRFVWLAFHLSASIITGINPSGPEGTSLNNEDSDCYGLLYLPYRGCHECDPFPEKGSV